MDEKKAYETCLICLQKLDRTNQKLGKLLCCRDTFHQNCIETWVSMQGNDCPSCEKLFTQVEIACGPDNEDRKILNLQPEKLKIVREAFSIYEDENVGQ